MITLWKQRKLDIIVADLLNPCQIRLHQRYLTLGIITYNSTQEMVLQCPPCSSHDCRIHQRFSCFSMGVVLFQPLLTRCNTIKRHQIKSQTSPTLPKNNRLAPTTTKPEIQQNWFQAYPPHPVAIMLPGGRTSNRLLSLPPFQHDSLPCQPLRQSPPSFSAT